MDGSTPHVGLLLAGLGFILLAVALFVWREPAARASARYFEWFGRQVPRSGYGDGVAVGRQLVGVGVVIAAVAATITIFAAFATS